MGVVGVDHLRGKGGGGDCEFFSFFLKQGALLARRDGGMVEGEVG